MPNSETERKRDGAHDPTESACTLVEAQNGLSDLALRANLAGERFVITRYGKETAAIVGLADLRRLRAMDSAEHAA